MEIPVGIINIQSENQSSINMTGKEQKYDARMYVQLTCLNYQNYRKKFRNVRIHKNLHFAVYTLSRKLNVPQSFIYLGTDYRNVGKETEHKICLTVDLKLRQRELHDLVLVCLLYSNVKSCDDKFLK